MPYRNVEDKKANDARRYAARSAEYRVLAAAHRANPANKISRTCPICEKPFFVPQSEITKGHGIYCSRQCRPAWNVGRKGIQPWMNVSGLNRPGERKGKATEFKKGCVSWSKLHPGKMPRGENHQSWKGGVTPVHKLIRRSPKYAEWRWAVFQRDGFTCQHCGQRGGELHADHIQQFAFFHELRFAVDNGRTLCVPCHRKTETWGRPSPERKAG